jgi:2-aminobenzoate-CoA ligase
MLTNVASRFLPDAAHRPLLTFGGRELQFVHFRTAFNAADELLDRTVARLGADRPAIHEPDRGLTWTYAQLQGAVNRLGNGLRRLGVAPGDRVLLRLPDIGEMAVAQLAVWKIGAVAVPTSVLERARELRFLLDDTEAALAIMHADHASDLLAAAADGSHLRAIVAVPGAGGGSAGPDAVDWTALLDESAESLAPHPTLPLDASGIYYTGGTTGQPKGCMHTHASEVFFADLTARVRAAGADDVFLTHAPIGHAFGNGEKINFPLRLGASAVYAQRPSPRRMLELAEPDPRAAFPGLALRSVLSSGEILDRPTQERWERALGVPLRNTVGMTPIRHIFIESAAGGRKVAPGLSVGVPLPGYEARLVDAVSGEPAAPGEPGRLALRGPSGITYWTNRHPFIREHAARDVRDGWSLLDDAYTRDEDGWLWFRARLDDMIVTGGRQVAAPEVEAVLREHPAVAEVAVVGAPDDVRGQVVEAFVVLREGHEPGPGTVQDLQRFAKREMAGYKYPRRVEFIAELPRDAVGKVQRRALRERAGEGGGCAAYLT